MVCYLKYYGREQNLSRRSRGYWAKEKEGTIYRIQNTGTSPKRSFFFLSRKSLIVPFYLVCVKGRNYSVVSKILI